MDFRLHHYYYLDQAAAERLDRMENKLGTLHRNQEHLMVDTSRIIAAVSAEKSKVDSLIALANGQTAALQELSTQLAAAIASGDPAALAQVQTDLDKAADDLSTETAAVAAAIDANTPAPKV